MRERDIKHVNTTPRSSIVVTSLPLLFKKKRSADAEF